MNTFTAEVLETKLINACEQGDIIKVRDYVLNHNAFNRFDGFYFFLSACANNRFEVVQFLLEQGADVNYKTRAQQTPLMVAGVKGGLELIDLLIGNGANINDVDVHGINALIHAIKARKFENAERLIDLGGDAFIKDSSLSKACEYIIIDSFHSMEDKGRTNLFLKIIDKAKEKYSDCDLINFYDENILKYPKNGKSPYIDIIVSNCDKLKLEIGIKAEADKGLDINGNIIPRFKI